MEEASLQQSRHTVEVMYDLSKIESDPVGLGSRFAFKANTVAFIFCNWKILLEKKGLEKRGDRLKPQNTSPIAPICVFRTACVRDL